MKKVFDFIWNVNLIVIAPVILVASGMRSNAQATVYCTHFNNTNFTKVIDLTRPVGVVNGTHGVTSLGGANYSIPIALPIGTNGFVPNVSVSYNSQGGNGVLGYGWSIDGLSSITRTFKNWYNDGKIKSVQYLIDDDFNIDGTRLVLQSGLNGANGSTYATEHETFNTITCFGSNASGPEWFRVVTKEGITMEYGNSLTSQIINAGKCIYWRLSKVVDQNGNYYEYVYDNTDNDSRIKEINYTGNQITGMATYNKINFDYSIRLDQNTSFDGGMSFNQKYLLDKITITGEYSALFKIYTFNHSFDDMYSYLSEVVETGTDGTQLNSTIFKYGEKPSDLVEQSQGFLSGIACERYSGDFDGDGYTDILACGTTLVTNFVRVASNFSVWKRTASSATFTQSVPTTSLPGNYEINENPITVHNTIINDFDGDGRDDILFASTINQNSGGGREVDYFRIYYPNNTATSFTNTDYFPANLTTGYPIGLFNKINSFSSNYICTGDFDGDGKSDFITFLSNGTGFKMFYTKPGILNNATVHNVYDANPYYDATDFVDADANYVIDFNGDGKSDIMSIKDGTCNIYEIILNSGGSYELNKLITNGVYPTKWHNISFGDFNGDGKTDILTSVNASTYKVSYSTGTGWQDNPSFTFNTPLTIHVPLDYSMFGNYYDDKILIADYNGDGKSDIAHLIHGSSNYKADIYFSTGTSFYYHQNIISGDLGVGQPLAVDFNGDGRSEIINYKIYTSPFKVLEINKDGTERLLEKVTDGYNATIEFDYDRLTSGSPFYIKGNGGNSTYPLNTIQYPIYNVSSLKVPDGIGGVSVSNYKYEEARMHRAGRGFLGFTKITKEDNQANLRTIVQNIFNTTYYFPLTEVTSIYQLSSGNLINTKTNGYAVTALTGGGNRYKIELSTNVEYNALQNVTTTSSNSYDSYSNLTYNSTSINTIESHTSSASYAAFGSSIPNLPITLTSSSTRLGLAVASTTTTFNYDSKGQLLTKVDFSGLANPITTTNTYSSLGNKISESVSASGMNPRTSTFVFDNKGRFTMSKSRDCISCGSGYMQSENYTYFNMWGLPKTYMNIECQIASYTLDGFGRIVSTITPTGVTILNNYGWDIGSNSVYYSNMLHPGKPDEKSWFDILGRETKKVVQLMSGQSSTVLTTYNNLGLIASQTNSHIAGVETPITTSFGYDSYNRLVTESNPLNTYNYTYTYNTGTSRLETNKTDIAGKFKKITTDPTGKILTSEDPGGRVRFTYDSWGNQKYIIQNNVPALSKVFDSYNRLISQQEVNAGIVEFEYNALGEIISQTDASGNNHTMDYDDLGRVITRTGPEGVTTYEYYCNSGTDDQKKSGNKTRGEDIPPDEEHQEGCCNNNISRITGFNGITQEFFYDGNARLISKKELVDGSYYTTQFSYDINSNLLSTTYPSGIQINNVYDANSYLLSVNQTGLSGNIYSTGGLNGMGEVTKYTLGNGKTTSLSYTNGFPTQVSTPTVQNYQYNWDYSSGNLLQRKDILKGLTESFTYDNLDRLTSSLVSGLSIQNYTYDPAPSTGATIGNIQTKDDAGKYKYLVSQVHTPSSIAHFTSTTLPPPNISPNTQDIRYTSFQRVDKISENGYDERFTYWPSYERVKTELFNSGTLQETRYFFGNYERQIIGTATPLEIHYVNGALGVCAIIVVEAGVPSIYYVYKDNLGSLNTITDASGNVITEQNFDAWGRKRNPNNWTYASIPASPIWLYRGYTGHEGLPLFGLINMNARFYDPVEGKMISPDNYVQYPYYSQSYNRYSYCLNNPVNYSDPTGNIFTGAFNTLLVGFFYTLFSGGINFNKSIRHEAWRKYDPSASWSKTNKAFKIDAGRFAWDNSRSVGGNLLVYLSRFTWEVPQVSIGNAYSHLRNLTGNVSVDYVRGATVVNHETGQSDWWGVTMGNYINTKDAISYDGIDPTTGLPSVGAVPININNGLVRHEYGHTIQSRTFGPFYFIPIMPWSGLSALINPQTHNQRWFERNADYFSKIYIENHP